MHIWFDFLTTLPTGLKSWMKEISLLGFDARNIYLKASTPFHILWFKEHVQPKFYLFLKKTGRKKTKIHFETSNQKDQKFLGLKEKIEKDNFINPLFTLENFFISKRNDLLSCAVKKKPDLLFLYGPPGAGKTHLLHALATKELKEKKRIAVTNSKSFIWHFTTAIRTKQMDIFRNFYRNAEALFFDNIEQIQGKQGTQEEFFHLFNSFHLMNKPMVFTANIAPNGLQLPSRLLSRFSMSFISKIEPLMEIELIDLLKIKAKKLNIELKPDAYLFFEKIKDSSKALMAFESLSIRLHDLKERIIDGPMIENLLKDFLKKEEKLGSDDILHAVAKAFSINFEELTSQSKRFAKQRAVAMYFFRNKLGLSYSAIGKLFNKDHSTVIAALKKFNQESSTHFKKIQQFLLK